MVFDRSVRKQLPLNMASNLALFVINVLVGLWMVPYLIGKLGVAGYGLIPLANQITQYATLVTFSVNGAVARYLAISINQKDFKQSNRIFNTAFFAMTGLLVLLVPAILIFSYFVPAIFEVPCQHIQDSRFLFWGIMGAFVLTTFKGNFAVSAYAMNRLDIRNLVDIIAAILRVVLIVGLFYIFSASLLQVGIAYFSAALLALMLNIFFCRKLTPQLSVGIDCFDQGCFIELLSTGGWLVVNQIGTLLFLNVDLIVVNKMFGATAGGEYSTILQWSSLIRVMGGAVAGAFSPVIFMYYANKQTDRIINFSKQAVKFTGLIIALPIGLLCGFSRPLLNVWLGAEFVHLAPLMGLMLIHLPINLAVLTLFNINVAANKVRTPGLVTLVMGCINIVLAISLPLITGWSFYGVAAAGAIVLTLKNAIFTPWYATRVLEIKSGTFNLAMLPGMVAAILIAGLSFVVGLIFEITSWISLALAAGVVTVVLAAVCWKWAITKDERRTLLSMLPGQS